MLGTSIVFNLIKAKKVHSEFFTGKSDGET